MRSCQVLLRATLLMVCALLPSIGFAIDAPGAAPDYLNRSVRPQWRMIDLGDAFRDLGDEIEKPVALSEGVEERERRVLLLEDTKSTVREVLELLERTHDLHFTAEPLRLVVRTGAEQRQRQRRLVNLNLRDYGVFFRPRDQFVQTPLLGPDQYTDGVSAFSDWEEDEQGLFDLEFLLDFLDTDEDSDAQIRGRGNLMLMVTPREEVRLRSLFEQIYEMVTRRSSWTVHFGTLPKSTQIRGGVRPEAEIAPILEQLKDRTELAATALDSQSVSAGTGNYEASIPDAEVNQTGRFPVVNPVVNTVSGGRTATLTPSIGIDKTLLAFEVQWVDLEPRGTPRNVRVPGISAPAAGGAQAPHWSSGMTFKLDQRVVWEWKPQGEVYVPQGHGVVLLTQRDDRILVVVLREEVQ